MGGEKEGKGRMIYAKGGEYEGEWKKGKREGHGVMVYGDGGVYDGQWKDDIEVIPRYLTTHPLFSSSECSHTCCLVPSQGGQRNGRKAGAHTSRLPLETTNSGGE
jgi:hypothetical protein